MSRMKKYKIRERTIRNNLILIFYAQHFQNNDKIK